MHFAINFANVLEELIRECFIYKWWFLTTVNDGMWLSIYMHLHLMYMKCLFKSRYRSHRYNFPIFLIYDYSNIFLCAIGLYIWTTGSFFQLQLSELIRGKFSLYLPTYRNIFGDSTLNISQININWPAVLEFSKAMLPHSQVHFSWIECWNCCE